MLDYYLLSIFRLLGLHVGAEPDAVRCYEKMLNDSHFNDPLAWDGDINIDSFDCIVCGGGHAAGMRQSLGSETLQLKLKEFWERHPNKPVGAICHGPLVLARSGVLKGVRSTALPKSMERAAYYAATALCLGEYYRTYPDYVLTMSPMK